MKIGILTFHEVYNPGAFLQAYATLTTLKSMGHDAHIINYTSPRHRFRPWRKLIRYPHALLLHPRGWLESFGRHAAFVAVQHHLIPTSRFNRHEDLARRCFDAIIIGSDIVWNYQSPLWGDDPVYFGHHLNCTKLIAYAASCGPLYLNSLAPGFVAEGLKEFDAISVRDYKTAKMVHQAIDMTVPLVMDPTFDLDIQNLPKGKIAPDKKYIFVYAMPTLLSKEAEEKIREYAQKRGLQIIAACYRQPWADRNIIDADPFDWVSLIGGASCVFTNTFHGTIFSAKQKKVFAVEFNPAIESKTSVILENLGLQNRQFKPFVDLSAILDCPYDGQKVNLAIEVCASQNRKFLRQALAD